MADKARNAIVVILGLAGAYALYRILVKKDSVPEAVKNTVEAPIKIAETVVDEIKDVVQPVVTEIKKETKKAARFVKGSPEAIKRMADLRAMKKPTSHKGHVTKRGLRQDQKRVSKQKHEVAYRKFKKVYSHQEKSRS